MIVEIVQLIVASVYKQRSAQHSVRVLFVNSGPYSKCNVTHFAMLCLAHTSRTGGRVALVCLPCLQCQGRGPN